MFQQSGRLKEGRGRGGRRGGFGHDRGGHANHGGGDGRSNHASHFGGGGSHSGGKPLNNHPHLGGDDRGPLNNHSHFGSGGDRGGPWKHHPIHPGDGGHHNTVTRSFPDLHQANETSYKLPNNTWEVGSSSSSQNLEKKSSSSDISEQFHELSIKSNNSSSSKFALRPNYGRKGRKCMVMANHFLMTLSPSLRYIHHYNVHILPEIKTKKLNRVVMEELVRLYKQSHLGNMLLAYDGQSSFYTAGSLPFTSKEFEVTTNEGKQYVVAISLVSVIDLQKLREILAGKLEDSAQEAIQAFDVVLRQTPLFKFVPVKRSFHNNDRTAVIAGGLEAWSGFFQSARLTQNGLSLNIDISAAVFVQNLKVTKFVEKILNYRELSKTKQLSDAERLKVCTIIGGQRYTKRLNENQTSDMVKLNSQKPWDRAAEILEIVRQNDYLKDEYAKEFGINITETLASVQARILSSPQLSYHGSDTSFQPKFGQWNLINKKLFEDGTVSSWSCVNFAVSDILARRFCEKLASLCNAHGMNFNPRPVLPPYGARAEQVERELETLQKDARARLKGKELDLLIVILPNNNGSLHGDVKRICETKLGLVSQCVLAGTVQKWRTQVMENIVLKIIAKVGKDQVPTDLRQLEAPIPPGDPQEADDIEAALRVSMQPWTF